MRLRENTLIFTSYVNLARKLNGQVIILTHTPNEESRPSTYSLDGCPIITKDQQLLMSNFTRKPGLSGR